MFLAEPNRTQFDLHFRLLGIPVRVHPLFWVISLLFGSRAKDPKLVLMWVLASFVSILIHELGHAVVIRYFGWRPWVTLYGMGGLASYRPTHHDPRKEIMISLAGPGAGFLLALVVVLVYAAMGAMVVFDVGWPHLIKVGVYSERLSELANDFANLVLYICVFWGLVNLLPIFPLDGGQVFRGFCDLNRSSSNTLLPFQVSMVTAGLVVAYGVYLNDFFLILFFGSLAVTNYQMMMFYRGGGGGFDPW